MTCLLWEDETTFTRGSTKCGVGAYSSTLAASFLASGLFGYLPILLFRPDIELGGGGGGIGFWCNL